MNPDFVYIIIEKANGNKRVVECYRDPHSAEVEKAHLTELAKTLVDGDKYSYKVIKQFIHD